MKHNLLKILSILIVTAVLLTACSTSTPPPVATEAPAAATVATEAPTNAPVQPMVLRTESLQVLQSGIHK